MARCLGMDGWTGGWVGVLLSDDGFVAPAIGTTLNDLITSAGPVDAVGVDVPIGWDGGDTRAVDDAARAFVGARRASVFAAPSPAAVAAQDYAAANAAQRVQTGRGLSKQAWFLVPRIREAQALVAAGLELAEIFPEASFAAMQGAPLAHPKTTWAGTARRRSLLAEHGIDLPDDLGPAGVAPAVDVLDAAAVAWSARRLARGEAFTLPADPPTATDGRRVCIWV